jgi:hypothetical protein
LRTTPVPTERLPKPNNEDSDHEWLHLLQMERIIEKQKRDLLESSHRHFPKENNHMNDGNWTDIGTMLESNFGGLSNLQAPNY